MCMFVYVCMCLCIYIHICKESDFEDEYINGQDLVVGAVVEVCMCVCECIYMQVFFVQIFGGDMFLYNCDQFTWEYRLLWSIYAGIMFFWGADIRQRYVPL